MTLLLRHRDVRCPYLTSELQPGSLASVELTFPLPPRYTLPPHYSYIIRELWQSDREMLKL